MDAAFLVEDWEIVAKKTNAKFWFSLLMLVAIPLELDQPPHSSVTWTIRQKSTGLVRRVTAKSLCEATEKVRQAYFDEGVSE
jgi:hypothetical protein